MEKSMSTETFQSLEHAGWQAKANNYDELFAAITNQAIVPILSTFGDLSKKRLLDVACGTGHIAGQAGERGALSEGIDFAATMIVKAKSNYPSVIFSEGNAEELPYAAEQFDAVACGFGLLHLENPERAIEEAWRVLMPGGRYTFTMWCSPEQGGTFFGLVMSAIKEHGALNAPLPPAPPIFRFADRNECTKVLTKAGFSPPSFEVLPLKWQASDAQDLLDLIYKSMVRMPMLLVAQTDSSREAIHQAILAGSEKYRQSGTIEFAFPALMVTAEK
jgi:SAM-dependent methyltransferase